MSRHWLCSVVLLYTWLVNTSSTVRIHYLHWNSSNPIFRIDNTDHIVDVNQGNQAWEYDQVNLICPWYNSSSTNGYTNKGGTDYNQERYIIYNVSKEEYETCLIRQAEPRVVAICDNPTKPKHFTITFRSFSPTPRGLEFHPGKDYFFISTSWKDDLYRRDGGSCKFNNMKIIFKVADNQQNESQLLATQAPAINTPRKTYELSRSDVIRPIEDVQSFRTSLELASHKRPVVDEENYREMIRRGHHVKQEASRMSSSSTNNAFSRLFISAVVMLAILLR